jgi:hypothetical protein
MKSFVPAFAVALSALASHPLSAQQPPPARGVTPAVGTPATKPVAAPRAAATDTGLVMGAFVSTRIDGKKLPVSDLATDDQGTQYMIDFAQLILTLKVSGEFRASLQYRQTLAAKGARVGSEPLQRMTVYGTWYREGTNIRFVPDPKRGGEGLRILAGTAAGKTITVPFDYQNGRVTRRANVILVYDPRIF